MSPYEQTAFSPLFYEGVGRVVMMAAVLDHIMIFLARGLAPSTAKTVEDIHSQAGGPLKELRRVLSQLPKGQQADEIRAFLNEATVTLQERNRVTHSLYAAMPILTPDGEAQRSPDGREQQWSLHPRRGAVNPTPTVEELADLVARLGALTDRAAALTPSDDE